MKNALLEVVRENPDIQLVNDLIVEGVIVPQEREFWELRCQVDNKIAFIKELKSKYRPQYLAEIFQFTLYAGDISDGGSFPGSLGLGKAKQIADRYFNPSR